MKCSDILYPPGSSRLNPTVATSLFLILFSTQITLTAPFSYLPAMVLSFGYSDRQRGFYAGIIASSLFVGRFFGGYFWGWLTDKIGRRPVLLLSSTLVLLATLAFGFSTTFEVAVLTRFLQGLFNGVIVCGRAAFAEICDETNQAIGVSLVFAAWNSAIVFGPAVGGFLAEPVKKYPSTFKDSGFFARFSFVLPSLLVVGILLMAIIMIFFTFKETKPPPSTTPEEDSEKIPLLNHQKNTSPESATPNEESRFYIEDQQIRVSYIIKQEEDGCFKKLCSKIKKWSLYELITDKTVMLVTMMFGMSGFCIIGFSELSSLWMATNSKYGGLNFSTDKIGTALLVPAIVSVIIQPIVFGRFEKRFGGIKTLQLSLLILAIFTFFFPFIHYTIKSRKLLWSLLITTGMVRMIADISSRSALALFINNSVYPEQAGRVNGFAFSVQEIMRVASPTMFGALFSWAIDSQQHQIIFPIDYRLPFLIIAIVIFGILALALLLPLGINGAKPVKDSPESLRPTEVGSISTASASSSFIEHNRT